MKKFLLYLLLIHTAFEVYAQPYEQNRFTNYSTKEGLSNNEVKDILQDNFGFIWLGTKKGLNRFDGSNFIQFYADSTSNSLPHDEIVKLKMLPDNLLAVITITGLFVINTQTLQSKPILIPADSLRYSYKVNAIRDIESDKAGNIYLLALSGFYVVNLKGQLIFRYDYYSSRQAESESFSFGNAIARYLPYYILSAGNSSLVFNKNARTLKATDQEQDNFLKKIANPAQRFVKLYNDETSLILLRDSVKHLDYYDLENKIAIKINLRFVTTEKFDWRSRISKINDTLFAISGKNKGFYLISYDKSISAFQFHPQQYFADYRVTQMLLDNESRLWISTTKGIFKQINIEGNIERFYATALDNPGKIDVAFTTLTVANDKIFAGSRKAGLFILNRSDGRHLKQLEFNDVGPSAINVFSCISFTNDTILAGTNGPLVMINNKSFQYTKAILPGWTAYNWVSVAYKSRGGDTYVAYDEAGQFYLRRHNEKNFQLYHHNQNPLSALITSHFIAEDNDGYLWFLGHGMSRYDIVNNRFDKKLDSFPKIKTARKEVIGLAIDKAGNMFFGVKDNGLVIYHPSTNHYEHITRSNGLPDNNILAVYLLKEKLWIGTESGIASYNIITKKITAFGIADNMPEESFTGTAFYFDSIHAHLYAPFANSIIRFNPYKLEKSFYSPVFFIESIRINDGKIFYHPQGQIKLKDNENNLQLSLANINYEDAWQREFYYRIKKQNNKEVPWQYAGSINNMVLNNLGSGSHILQLKVSSKTNSWPPQFISLSVYISPPFWKRTWFILSAAAILIISLFLLYKARINSIRQKANRDKQLAELEILSLHAQMNPHFIFNALNSIKEMIWQNDKQNASRYLSKFAQLIRSTLEQSRQPFITVNQCVQHLEQYLEMERIRFDEFVYSIELDKNMDGDHIHMAPMLVQPLVENAIWHGLKSKDGNRKLEIKFYQDKKHIVCEIGDNGPGINHTQDIKKTNTAHKSISIINIHSRLQMLNEKYNMQCSLQLIDKGEADATLQGTTAILRLSI